jgi:integrase
VTRTPKLASKVCGEAKRTRLDHRWSTDDDLLVAVLERDEAAWREFERRFATPLRDAVLAATDPPLADDQVDDVVADFWLRLLESDMQRLRTYDARRGTPLATWLALRISQLAYERVRRQCAEPHTVADRRLDEIGTREFEAIKARLLAMKKRPKTINNVLAVLSKLLHYAAEVGHIDKAPRVKLLRVPPQSFDFLGDDEYATLREGTASDPDLHAAILVAADAGLRRGEILGLHWEDVDLRSRRLTVRRSLWAGELTSPKGGRERTIPMTDRLAKALARIRHLRGPFAFCRDDGSPWTWEVMRAALPRACKLGGIRTVRWHALRHTFCTHLAMRGAPAKAIQEAAGHASLTTTLKYMHLAPRVLDDAIGLLEKDVAWQQSGKGNEKAANPG